MYPVYFSALLMTDEGKLLEAGQACLSRTENKVTFKNEFVPLVKLDSTVEIVRILGNRQLERFRGTVYLSSRNLLQIMEVEPQLMVETRKLFDINTYLPVMVTIGNEHNSFSGKNIEIVAGTLRYLSTDTVKLSVMPYIGEGQQLMLECENPLALQHTVVRVEKRELLGRQAALLICSIVAAPGGEKAAINTYAAALAKLEIDVDTESDPPELDQSLLQP